MKLRHKLQLVAIPFVAVISVLFGLFLISLPLGLYVVYDTDIGDSINDEFPISHLEIFADTSFYQTWSDPSIGDAFAVLWVIYLVVFVVAILGPRSDLMRSISHIISFGYSRDTNYMLEIIKWFSILVLISSISFLIQNEFGITIESPTVENDLIQFFFVSLAPLIEEIGFRMILIGIPLFLIYSGRSSIRFFLKCLWRPASLDIVQYRWAIALIISVGVFFGFAHIGFADSWSDGKFLQAMLGGIILGWVYLRYGFAVSLLVHWGTNYFVYTYLHFISQSNDLLLSNVYDHPLLSTLETLLLVSGCLSVLLIITTRLYRSRDLEQL